MAQHIAHLFIRDPLTLFEEKIHLDDANESDHFEVVSDLEEFNRCRGVCVKCFIVLLNWRMTVS